MIILHCGNKYRVKITIVVSGLQPRAVFCKKVSPLVHAVLGVTFLARWRSPNWRC